ncbi:MAG: DUF123 domain-containing protein [Deltaproteobacteria bacterium]|nr:DUF123 domain-containing protein [Deltaproteobacteria bacterium]
MNGLRRRLTHHLRKTKKSRWHIDYLVRARGAKITAIVAYPGPLRRECVQNQRIAALFETKTILRGFGSSDCVAGCASHLFFLPRSYSSEQLIRLLI